MREVALPPTPPPLRRSVPGHHRAGRVALVLGHVGVRVDAVNYIYLFEFEFNPRNVDTPGARRGRPSSRPFDLAVALTRCGALQWTFSTLPWTRRWCASSACSCTTRSVSVAPTWSDAEVGPLSHKSWTPLSYPVLPPLSVLQAVNDKFLALIPPLWYPTFLILYTIKRLIFPLRTRLPLWTAIKHVAMAPFITPTFFVTYVGDVFSMVKVFQDLLFAVCLLPGLRRLLALGRSFGYGTPRTPAPGVGPHLLVLFLRIEAGFDFDL